MKLDPYREYREPGRVADANWNRALAREDLSLGAQAAQHDLQCAAHRPGGKIKPRHRWATDEKNKFGQW